MSARWQWKMRLIDDIIRATNIRCKESYNKTMKVHTPEQNGMKCEIYFSKMITELFESQTRS